MYVQAIGTMATDAGGQREQPAQARPGHPEHPGEDGREHERSPEVGLEHDQDERRTDQQAGAEDRAERIEATLTAGQVVGQDDDHEDLGKLAELERERPDADPASGPADTAADGQRQDEDPELDGVDRPGQRLEPAVVERRSRG
jgi:hypothetical protein